MKRMKMIYWEKKCLSVDMAKNQAVSSLQKEEKTAIDICIYYIWGIS